jgi:hypothetical protein
MFSKMSRRKFTAADLTPGKDYRVARGFVDYDQTLHPIGEIWRFLAKDFLPYDDGLTLHVERDGRKSVLRLQWRAETQGEIIDSFSDFVDEL